MHLKAKEVGPCHAGIFSEETKIMVDVYIMQH